MAKSKIFMLSIMFVLLSCSSNNLLDSETISEDTVPNGYVNVNFLPKGLDVVKTRSAISEAGLFGTYLIDEQEGAVCNYRFCNAEADLSIPLKLGTHKIYMVATGSKYSEVDINEKIVKFGKVSDTYLWSGDVNVTPNIGSIEANVKRMNYKLSFLLTDKIPANAVKVSVLISSYYKNLSITGGTIETSDTYIENITITDEQKSLDYGACFDIYGFSPNSYEYTTECNVSFLDSEGNTITIQRLFVPLQNGYHTKVMGNYSQIGTGFSPVIDVSYMGEKEIVF